MSNGAPQLEDGFWKLAHELTRQLYVYDFTKRELPVILFIIHKTYAWGKTEDWIATEQIAEATGFDVDNVRKTVAALVASKVLIKDQKKIGLNKYYEEWTTAKRVFKPRKRRSIQPAEEVKATASEDAAASQNSPTKQVETTGKEETSAGQNYRQLPVETTGVPVKPARICRSNLPPTKEKKETLTKEKKETIAHLNQKSGTKKTKSKSTISIEEMRKDFPDLTEQTATDWLAVRKAKKAPLTPTAWKRISSEIIKSGVTADEAIAIAAERGWQSIKSDWIKNHISPSTKTSSQLHSFDDVDYSYGANPDGTF